MNLANTQSQRSVASEASEPGEFQANSKRTRNSLACEFWQIVSDSAPIELHQVRCHIHPSIHPASHPSIHPGSQSSIERSWRTPTALQHDIIASRSRRRGEGEREREMKTKTGLKLQSESEPKHESERERERSRGKAINDSDN